MTPVESRHSDVPARGLIPAMELRRLGFFLRRVPVWPLGWTALLWRSVAWVALAAMLLMIVATVLRFHGAPDAVAPQAAPADLAPPDVHARPAPRAQALSLNPFATDHRFPASASGADTHVDVPVHWRDLPPQTNANLQLYGVVGGLGHYRALVGSPKKQRWYTVGAQVKGWTLRAIRADRVLWSKGQELRYGAVIPPPATPQRPLLTIPPSGAPPAQ
ncbi:MAG: hypothetical protein KGJ12_03045 [Gammaproteobacteria bacterium]|nr:hypothetical protein [Gammaproteobacteria bacterium]